MKKILFLLLVALILISCNQQKIGYVDNSKLINEYQEKIDNDASIQLKIQDFQRRTDSIRKAFQLEINDAEIKARKMSQSGRQELSKELQDKEQVLSQRLQFEQTQINQENRIKTDSLIKKVKEFVANYGKQNGYTFILGSNEAGSVMYGEEQYDLTELILEALNTSYKDK